MFYPKRGFETTRAPLVESVERFLLAEAWRAADIVCKTCRQIVGAAGSIPRQYIVPLNKRCADVDILARRSGSKARPSPPPYRRRQPKAAGTAALCAKARSSFPTHGCRGQTIPKRGEGGCAARAGDSCRAFGIWRRLWAVCEEMELCRRV